MLVGVLSTQISLIPKGIKAGDQRWGYEGLNLSICSYHCIYLEITYNDFGEYKDSWLPSFLFTGCPLALQDQNVDIPPLIAVSTIGLWITGCSGRGVALLAHRVRIGARFTDGHKLQHSKYWCDRYDMQYLRLQALLVNDCWFVLGQPICQDHWFETEFKLIE